MSNYCYHHSNSSDRHEYITGGQRAQCPYSPKPYPCGCTRQRGKSAYEIAVCNGFVGTEAEWLLSLKCKPAPFLSSYLEVLGNGQTVASGGTILFDSASDDSVGGAITIDPTGATITIRRPGLYLVEWDVNLAADTTSAVIGIVENGEGASGASTNRGGNFSSGTLIQVKTVPFTLSLRNYGDGIVLENPVQWEDSAASIRILRFADGAIK